MSELRRTQQVRWRHTSAVAAVVVNWLTQRRNVLDNDQQQNDNFFLITNWRHLQQQPHRRLCTISQHHRIKSTSHHSTFPIYLFIIIITQIVSRIDCRHSPDYCLIYTTLDHFPFRYTRRLSFVDIFRYFTVVLAMLNIGGSHRITLAIYNNNFLCMHVVRQQQLQNLLINLL